VTRSGVVGLLLGVLAACGQSRHAAVDEGEIEDAAVAVEADSGAGESARADAAVSAGEADSAEVVAIADSAAASDVTVMTPDAAHVESVPSPFCWENPGTSSNILNRVWATASNDVWAVGTLGTVRHWNGTTISEVDSPTHDYFTGVWASGPSDAWAVSNSRVMRWDGHTWSQVLEGAVSGIWGSAADDVWVGGSALHHWDGRKWNTVARPGTGPINGFSGRGRDDFWATLSQKAVMHWNGQAWRLVPTPESALDSWESPTGTLWISTYSGKILRLQGDSFVESFSSRSAEVLHLWGTSDNDVWTVGDAVFLHFDGTAWTQFESTVPGGIESIAGSSSSDVWAVGAQMAMVHWDGTRWSRPESEGISQWYSPVALSGTGVNDVWAGGSQYLQHWNGSAWGHLPILAIQHSMQVRKIWADGAGSVWVVPGSGAPIRWDGKQWSTFNMQTSSVAIWGRAHNDAWTVGSAIVPASSGNPSSAISHWNGTSWQAAVLPASMSAISLSDVWGSGPNDVYAVGATSNKGQIIHWDGASWTAVFDATRGQLFKSIWGSGPQDVWVTSDPGGLVHWDGSTWQFVVSESNRRYVSICGGGPGDMSVLDETGNLRHWDGTKSTPVDVQGVASLQSIWQPPRGSLWATSEQGLVLNQQGDSWRTLPRQLDTAIGGLAGASARERFAIQGQSILSWDGAAWKTSLVLNSRLAGIWALDDTHAWAVGAGGTIAAWDGKAWKRTDFVGTQSLNGVWGAASDDVWAVGSKSTILHKDATRWTVQPLSGPLAAGDFKGVFGISSIDVWAFGYSGAVAHWDGSTWSLVAIPAGLQILSISGQSSDALWAVATGIDPARPTPKLLTWNGQSWREQTQSSGPIVKSSYPNQIWARGANDIWIAAGAAWHWDGAAWSSSPSSVGGVGYLWGDSKGSMWGAGGAGVIVKLR
jgi:hypothetical protein